CVEQDDKGWDARKRAYCLKIQPATGSFARNLIYSTKPDSHKINNDECYQSKTCSSTVGNKNVFFKIKFHSKCQHASQKTHIEMRVPFTFFM
ncbi:hypothetical protein, partial [Escherichia coli]|uniref:hypothetical protein n=1 Tax=Escherichia coli TaxID=562 RepID=UPI001BC89A7C